MQSLARTVDQYILELPPDRIEPISKLVDIIRKNLPEGFAEGMSYGMIGWVVPHSIYPKGYHCDPKQALPFISLASQKNHISLYHMALYGGALLDWFTEQWKLHSAKKLDMGKGCIRFKKAEDIPYSLIGELSSKITPGEWINFYESNLKKG
jgi:uncharacterized protein YdhG (YjbR/CyaY superfamily)